MFQPDDEGKPLENAERRPSGVADAEGDLPRFTLNELRRILNERNHLKAKVMELQDEIDITRRGRVADIPCTSVSSLSDQIHLADARIAFLRYLQYIRISDSYAPYRFEIATSLQQW